MMDDERRALIDTKLAAAKAAPAFSSDDVRQLHVEADYCARNSTSEKFFRALAEKISGAVQARGETEVGK
jgi:hypothetical protein